MSRPRILICEPRDFGRAALDRLMEFADVECAAGEVNFFESLNAFDVVWVRLGCKLTRQMMPPDPRCRILACNATGLDHIDLQACSERNIRVVSLKGEVEFLREVRATAEHTLGLMIALVRQIPAATQHVTSGGWDRDAFRGFELYDKTVGIVGTGRLGTIVAEYCRALGMTVVGYDPYNPLSPDIGQSVDSLQQLLQISDYVSLHVSLNEETYHLIDTPQFVAMKPSAFLINTSRGGVINETALGDALRRGIIAGAAVDVLEGEPNFVAPSELVELAKQHPRLLITPHLGGNTYESFEKTEWFIANRIKSELESEYDQCAS